MKRRLISIFWIVCICLGLLALNIGFILITDAKTPGANHDVLRILILYPIVLVGMKLAINIWRNGK